MSSISFSKYLDACIETGSMAAEKAAIATRNPQVSLHAAFLGCAAGAAIEAHKSENPNRYRPPMGWEEGRDRHEYQPAGPDGRFDPSTGHPNDPDPSGSCTYVVDIEKDEMTYHCPTPKM